MTFTFAIIGGGLAGTSMLYQFVEKARGEIHHGFLKPSDIKLQVFEKQETFGPGFPHCDRNVMPFHITNMCAKDMSILFGNKMDFQEWVIHNQQKLKELFACMQDASFIKDQCNHYPRAVMGEYLKARFEEAYQKAQALGLLVDLYAQSEVIDLEETCDKIRLTVRRLTSGSIFSCVADRVLLATGHWSEEKRQRNYFPSPWPAQNLLESIPQGEKIAVIGTSLSAIEVVLTLTSDGHFVRDEYNRLVYIAPPTPKCFALYSRKGLLPKVRGKMGMYRNRFLTREKVESLITFNKGFLTLEAVFQLLKLELEAVYGHGINWKEVINPTQAPADLLQQYIQDAKSGDGPDGELLWQTVLHQSFDMVREIYSRLPLEDRKRFDKEYTSIFFTHAATQPIMNAEKILALMNAGIVEIFKLGRDYSIVKNPSKEEYELIYTDHKGNIKRAAYRYLVNARGQSRSIRTDPSALTKNMLQRGIVQTEETQIVHHIKEQNSQAANPTPTAYQTYQTGSMWIDPKTHQIMRQSPDKKTTKIDALYAVGAMTRGQIIDTSTAYGIVQSTCSVAEGLINDLKKILL
jgi:uncharacterized NAD(P)/FAD-binding protein YdhS